MNPRPFPPISDETRFLENAQMAGNFILGCFQGAHQLTDAQFSLHEKSQESQAQGFAQRLMKRSDVFYPYMRHAAYCI